MRFFHPVKRARRAVTPAPVKRARRAAFRVEHPVKGATPRLFRRWR